MRPTTSLTPHRPRSRRWVWTLLVTLALVGAAAAPVRAASSTPAVAGARDPAKPDATAATSATPAATGAAAAEAADQAERNVAPTIVANRPGFAESTEVVGAGVVQVEGGVNFDRDGTFEQQLRTVTGPFGLVRLGLAPRFELQVSGEGMFSRLETTPHGHSRVSGGSDFDLGAKIKLVSEARAHVTMSLAGSLNVPAGSAAFTSGGYDPTIKLALGRTIGPAYLLYSTLQAASVTDAAGRFTQRGASIALSRTLPAGWGTYGELFVVTPCVRGAAAAGNFDGGVVRTVGRNVQVDAWIAHGLNDVATNWSYGVGIAVRHVGPTHLR